MKVRLVMMMTRLTPGHRKVQQYLDLMHVAASSGLFDCQAFVQHLCSTKDSPGVMHLISQTPHKCYGQ